MDTEKEFVHSFTVFSSLERVVEFHNDPRALKRLTPPPLFITFNQTINGTKAGIADFNIWLGPISIRWKAAITPDETTSGFVDRQIEGPFDYWEHRHSFLKIDSHTTQVVDQIRGRPGKHIVNGLISKVMWLTLPLLFSYRAWRTRVTLEKNRS